MTLALRVRLRYGRWPGFAWEREYAGDLPPPDSGPWLEAVWWSFLLFLAAAFVVFPIFDVARRAGTPMRRPRVVFWTGVAAFVSLVIGDPLGIVAWMAD